VGNDWLRISILDTAASLQGKHGWWVLDAANTTNTHSSGGVGTTTFFQQRWTLVSLLDLSSSSSVSSILTVEASTLIGGEIQFTPIPWTTTQLHSFVQMGPAEPLDYDR
jgi:hypothetical protein